MRIEGLGSLETEVLIYIVKAKAPQPLFKIKDALRKEENSAAAQPINTLIDKKYLKKSKDTYKPKRGRPGSLYEVTEAGLSRYILEVKENFGEELEYYKKMSNTMYDLNQIYKVLEGYPRRDQYIIDLIYMVISLLEGGFSGEDTYAMGQAWNARRQIKLPSKYRKRLLKMKAKTQGDYAKEVKNLVEEIEK